MTPDAGENVWHSNVGHVDVGHVGHTRHVRKVGQVHPATSGGEEVARVTSHGVGQIARLDA